MLVVDDNVDAAETLRDLLSLSGHDVSVAHDGEAAVARALALRPDVVFCDIGLPRLDGYGVARACRADPSTRGAYLVALTGYALPEDLRRAAEAGFDEHLAKPPPLAAIEAAVARSPRERPRYPRVSASAETKRGAMSTGTRVSRSRTRRTSGRTTAIFLEQGLRGRPIAPALDGHDLAGERDDRLAHPGGVDRERPVRPGRDRARVEEPAQLERHAAPVRLADAEPDRAERGRDERRVERALHGAIELPLVEELLEREQARHVGLRLLERAVGVAELGADGRLPAGHGDLVRPEAVQELVHEDVSEERLERDRRAVRLVERDLGDG